MINLLPKIEVFEGIISIIATFLFIIGFSLTVIIYIKKRNTKKRNITTIFLILLMLSGISYSFSNIFEKFQIWEKADEFGDAITVFFATIFLIIGLVVILEEKLQSSENKYREAFNHANFYKDLFTHDMSNVIQNIKTSTELYFLNLSKFDKSKMTELLEIIKEQSLRGANLISNVRKLSKLEDSEIQLVNIDVIAILRDTIKYINKIFQSKNLNITFDDVRKKEYFIYANELLTDVFENVIINALTYNENPTIDIQIRVSEENDKKNMNCLKIEFIDNGIGISDARKKIIFIKGFEVEKRTKGMGLGLSLVKEIVESYDGEIKVKNNVKEDYTKGSNFILKFPLISLEE